MLIAESDDLRMGDKKPRAAAAEPGPPWILGGVLGFPWVLARSLLEGRLLACEFKRTKLAGPEGSAEHHGSSLLQMRPSDGRPLPPSKLAHWANIAHGQRAPQDASRVGRTSTRALTLVGTMARSNGTIY